MIGAGLMYCLADGDGRKAIIGLEACMEVEVEGEVVEGAIGR
jgi:hypothetical protein